MALKHEPKYSKLLRDYASTIGVKERGLKKWIHTARTNWIAAGCPAGGPSFPPLDQPEKLLEWRLANMSYTPSTTTYGLAAGAASPTTKPADQTGAPPAPAPRALVNIAEVRPMKFADAVERQERYVGAAMAAYDAALMRPGVSAAELNTLGKERDNALATLRACQSDLAKAELERGDRPHLNDIRAELAPLLSHLALSFIDLLVDRIGLPRGRARELADEWFRELTTSRFTAGDPAAAQPPSPVAA